MRILFLSALVLSSLFFLTGKAQAEELPVRVINAPEAGAFPLATAGQAATIVVDPQDVEVVRIAAEAFRSDLKAVTGVEPAISHAISGDYPVIIGTLGRSTFINQLVAGGKLQASDLENRWETFRISVVDQPLANVSKALVIAGSDPRGTAFGVFELSRMMGVSPWIWWADVAPEPRNQLYVTAGKSIFGPPSVQYRGFFINDEDWGIQPWAARNMDKTIRPNGKGDMGPLTYAKIFELMLRMKANYLWPAMHACTKAFWFYPANPEMARKYSIVLGSSHCEQMLRDNEDEWRNNFATEYGHASGDWNWKTNSANITKYWTDRVKQAKNTEAVYTMGMRGIHDSGIPGYDTDEERRGALHNILAAQRNILSTHLEKPLPEVPQVFIPYKEVLKIYNLGVNVPDDIALMWADDNFGYMRQLSNPAEQARSGGGGIYYHFSYLGPPQSYLWLSSVTASVAAFELRKAYELNCKRMWIFNVGDIKPQEFELQFAMDMAWNVHSVELENPNRYAQQWGAETFGEAFGQQVYEIKREYFRLAASGKPEHVSHVAYSVAQMEQRLADYNRLLARVDALEAQIPGRLKDAFFQLIRYPVEGAAAMNVKHLGGKLSFEYALQGRNNEALDIAAKAVSAYQKIIDLTQTYNKTIAGGKWDGMMSYSPNKSGYFYDPTVYSTPGNASTDHIMKLKPDSVVTVPAENYTTANGAGHSFKTIDGLGIANGVTVFPYNMTAYTEQNITAAPYLEYSVPVLKGMNAVSVLCLPSFPLYKGLKLRYAVSIAGATPVFVNIESDLTGESSSLWGQNVLRGYTAGETNYESNADKTVAVKVYFPDPALVVSAIRISSSRQDPLTDHTNRIVNPSFENTQGLTLDGASYRGNPYGWTRGGGAMTGKSWGVNKDMTNRDGNYACWYNSTPLPANFELYQTIGNLPEGEYAVRCRMAAFSGKLGTARLFANNNVQYFASPADYVSNIVPGENYTFANRIPQPSGGGNALLQEMAVKVTIATGESLKIGIRTSNMKSDGTLATDAEGWFKVDHFRLECLKLHGNGQAKADLDSLLNVAGELYNTTTGGDAMGEYPAASRTVFNAAVASATAVSGNAAASVAATVAACKALETAINNYRDSRITATSFIVNPSFEYKAAGVLNDGTPVKGKTPYGWSDTGGIDGTSFGINNDAINMMGNNVCWYTSTPTMPANFELYQTLTGLPAGKYTLTCRMAVMDGKISTQRLFANNSVQYFGKETDYGQNIVAGETRTFAGWSYTSSAYYLKNMSVDVTLDEGAPLRLGVRTSNKKANGQPATDISGWFKVDHFQLELKELLNPNGLDRVVEENLFVIQTQPGGCRLTMDVRRPANVRVVSLSGQTVYCRTVTETETRIPLPAGLYVVQVQVGGLNRVVKVFVK
jgi:hypothetical protein